MCDPGCLVCAQSRPGLAVAHGLGSFRADEKQGATARSHQLQQLPGSKIEGYKYLESGSGLSKPLGYEANHPQVVDF